MLSTLTLTPYFDGNLSEKHDSREQNLSREAEAGEKRPPQDK